MEHFTFVAHNLQDTDRLGAALAKILPNGTTVALSGTLGAGKTRLVQAVAAGCGVPREEVVSPTFVLCQQYQGARMMYHLDAYRLKDDDEFLELGPEELFASPAITLIEWAERVRDCLPAEYLEVQIELGEDDLRRFHIRAIGPALGNAVRELSDVLQS